MGRRPERRSLASLRRPHSSAVGSSHGLVLHGRVEPAERRGVVRGQHRLASGIRAHPPGGMPVGRVLPARRGAERDVVRRSRHLSRSIASWVDIVASRSDGRTSPIFIRAVLDEPSNEALHVVLLRRWRRASSDRRKRVRSVPLEGSDRVTTERMDPGQRRDLRCSGFSPLDGGSRLPSVYVVPRGGDR